MRSQWDCPGQNGPGGRLPVAYGPAQTFLRSLGIAIAFSRVKGRMSGCKINLHLLVRRPCFSVSSLDGCDTRRLLQRAA
jgi:hypothetical protein